MLAYGFKTALLVELIDAGFATTSIERTVVEAQAELRALQRHALEVINPEAGN